jgi:cytochrome c553
MKGLRRTLAWATLVALAPTALQAGDGDDAQIRFFESKVRPVLIQNCYSCHSAKSEKLKGGLRLDSREGMLKGGEVGPAIVAGQPEKSRLILAVQQTDKDLQMPPKSKLPDAAIADLAAWIRMGAPWPKEAAPVAADTGTKTVSDYDRLRREHWAWQPLKRVPPPAVKDAAWPADDIDRFILARLEEKGLAPVGPADPYTLIRRVTFDLTGLPPSPEEVEAFAKDPSPAAFEKVVDRLLASPRFGERWGRHWLDLARYGESAGSTRNVPYPNAWRYRDYVIESFNEDKPYDRFIREQVAGDLLPGAGDEERIATGFLVLGSRDLNERNNEQYLMDSIDDAIDVTGRAVLGITVSCARCHDHKFDPVPTADYYALAGILKSSVFLPGVANRGRGGGQNYYHPELLVPLGAQAAVAPKPEPENPRKKGKTAKARPAKSDPPVEGPAAMGVKEGAPVDAKIYVRGDVDSPGATVPRGVLTLLKPIGQPGRSSGRLALADWLVGPENPLTPRVMVNRIWKHLFGEGLVYSVDNFGTTGDKPSHPELLDHLALRFRDGGASVKKLIRSIVLTRAYRLSGEGRPSNAEIDPGNVLLWRANRRRLDAEAIRDAILAAGGRLELTPPAGSPVQKLPPGQPIGGGKNGASFGEVESRHRSVYLPILRDYVPDFLEVFDFAEPSTLTGRRDTTTVATQALMLLNSRFVVDQSKSFAERMLARPLPDDGARIEAAYLAALSRPPSAEERARATKFLGQAARAAAWQGFCQALLASAEFRYLNYPPAAERKAADVRR